MLFISSRRREAGQLDLDRHEALDSASERPGRFRHDKAV